MIDDGGILLQQLAIFRVLIMRQGCLPGAARELLAATGIQRQRDDRVHESAGVVRAHQHAAHLMTDVFGQPAGARGDYGEPGGHGLERHEPAGLGARGKDAEIGGGIEGGQAVAVNEPQLTDKGGPGGESCGFGAFARDHERGPGSETATRAIPGIRQDAEVLLPGETADVEHDHRVVCAREPATPSGRATLGAKVPRVDAPAPHHGVAQSAPHELLGYGGKGREGTRNSSPLPPPPSPPDPCG